MFGITPKFKDMLQPTLTRPWLALVHFFIVRGKVVEEIVAAISWDDVLGGKKMNSLQMAPTFLAFEIQVTPNLYQVDGYALGEKNIDVEKSFEAKLRRRVEIRQRGINIRERSHLSERAPCTCMIGS